MDVLALIEAFGEWYDAALASHTILTVVVTSMIIMSLGDVATQLIMLKKTGKYSFLQSAKMMVWGAEYAFVYHYILVLLAMIDIINPVVSALIKVLIDQLVAAVIINVCFYTTLSLLQDCNHPLRRAWTNIRTRLLPTMKANWCIWPFVQMANFFFIPVEYQTLVCNCFSFFWSMILSFIAFKKEDKKELPTKQPTAAVEPSKSP